MFVSEQYINEISLKGGIQAIKSAGKKIVSPIQKKLEAKAHEKVKQKIMSKAASLQRSSGRALPIDRGSYRIIA